MVPRLAMQDGTRPRVEGEREEEILDAVVEMLMEAGYERLTMDAVARRARASKATLYRRWETKQSLVVDAVIRSKQMHEQPLPDTGSLRDDLRALFCGPSSNALITDSSRVLGVVLTALQTDPQFAEDFRTRFIAPKITRSAEVYRRAAERGELAPGVDLSILGPAFAGILLHRRFVLGEELTPDLVDRVLDQIIIPAATGRPFTSSTAVQEKA
jgi:AcrR family transcriptional regulator